MIGSRIRALLACAVIALTASAQAEIIYRDQSLYQTILVDQRGSVLCLQFSVRQDQRNQSCVDQRNPRKMVFGYTQMIMAALLLNPEPESILMIGLGGGTIAVALAELFPQASIEVVEIDPAVDEVARRYFGFQENEHINVTIQDGRVFTKRAGLKGKKYDLIILDAFNGDYIPEHLMTREYLEETKALLTSNGVIAANTFAISDLYDHESATYAAVFGQFFNLRRADTSNRVIFASEMPLPSVYVMAARAKDLEESLKPYGVPIKTYPRAMLEPAKWDKDARVLTDQYSPANLLNQK
ncbi:MAG: fused MFS/spermidine synthase [Proteobacteria bacterium]|nr:fused MFS/spermidine synthase [Pseudomonadota bacterium]